MSREELVVGSGDLAPVAADSGKVEQNESFWAAIGHLIAPVTAFSLVLSIVYDWGYFEAIGLSFAEVPTTITDHIRTALVWAPMVFTGLLIGVSWAAMWSSRDSSMSKEAERAPSFYKRHKTKAFVAASFLVIWAHWLWGDFFSSPMVVAVGYLALVATEHWLIARLPVGSMSAGAVAIVAILPSITLSLYFIGFAMGTEQLYRSPKVLINASLPEEVSDKVTVLKYMERGLLVATEDGKAIFLGWDQIRSVEQPLREKQQNNRMCRFFDVGCDLRPTPSD